MGKWLGHLEKFLSILRPKAYNVIARIVIGLGIALVAESQLNIVQALTIAFYENFAGRSEILREFLNGSSNPSVGILLIFIGVIYHYLMTVGMEQIQLRISALPQQPKLEIELLNSDLELYEGDLIALRGCLLDVPSQDDIPKYRINYNLPNMEGLNGFINTFGNMDMNQSFYKERGEFLKIWGGSELITLKLKNNADLLATGVSVEIRLPKVKGVSADNTKDNFPVMPDEKPKDSFPIISSLSLNSPTVHYDVKRNHNDSEYCFNWDVGNIQANTSCVSDTFIFLRCESGIPIKVSIFCDQLSKPSEKEYQVTAPSLKRSVTVDDLKQDNNGFIELANECVMNGYLKRVAQKHLNRHERDSDELLPR